MKAKINGVELEGNVDEIMQVLQNLKNEDNKVKNKELENHKQVKNKENYKCKHRKSKIDWKSVFENATETYKKTNKSLSNCLKLALERKSTPSGDETKTFKKYLIKQGIEVKIRRKKQTRNKPSKGIKITEYKIPDFRAIRSRFIMTKANYLMKQFNYSREKACSMAAQEWDSKKVKKNKVVKKMPSIIENENFNKILFDILKNVINKKGKMSFINEAYTLGLNTTKEYLQVIRKIIMNSDSISRYFNVENKFKITSEMELYYN